MASALPATVAAQSLPPRGCVDYRGLRVPTLAEPRLADLASATWLADGSPVVLYNPVLLLSSQPLVRIFFYLHECGHHALGHLRALYCAAALPVQLEQEADCFAIRELMNQRALHAHDLSLIEWELAHLGRGDWDHLPGPVRAINLRRCLLGAAVRAEGR